MSAAYHYTFSSNVSVEDVELFLVQSLISAEHLHGPARVRLEVSHRLFEAERSCIIDASTEVGEDFNKLFLGSLQMACGPDSFHVERFHTSHSTMVQFGGENE